MLTEIAEGVLVHESRFCQSNAVVVQGRDGVLVVDAGVHADELVCVADDIRGLGRRVVAGFSTHPHWDHLLWHRDLGVAPRYATARCAATAEARLSDAGAKARVTAMMPPEIVDHVPLDLLGAVTGLPAETGQLPWDGPSVRIVEHQSHAHGHASLHIEHLALLQAGDMLSDLLIPMIDLSGAADPVGDYLTALQLLEDAAGDAEVVVPGHGSVGGAVRARIAQDRAYLDALRDGKGEGDWRLEASKDWLPAVQERHLQRLSQRA
jgi:glyoxylase-like metal-dependent hydrolase (beta-lactamase superfamily II)